MRNRKLKFYGHVKSKEWIRLDLLNDLLIFIKIEQQKVQIMRWISVIKEDLGDASIN